MFEFDIKIVLLIYPAIESLISISSLLSGTRLVKNVSEQLQAATIAVHMALSYVFGRHFVLIMKNFASSTFIGYLPLMCHLQLISWRCF